jgi:hypothetical protein
MAHVKIAKQLYDQGYCVYNTEITWNGVKKIPISPPKTGTMTYEETRITNAVVLLTGIRQGSHPELKHCICLDLDKPKDYVVDGETFTEVDGEKFIKKHKKLFSDTYIENTGNGGRHYIYLLDVDKPNYTIKTRGRDLRLRARDEDYSIDILANGACVILAPSKYKAGNQIKKYTTDMSLIDDINYIPDKLYNMLNITEVTELKKAKKRQSPREKVKRQANIDNNDDVDYDEKEFEQIKFLLKNLIKSNRFDGREAWIGLGYALKQYGNKGLELYHEVSSRSDKYDEGDTAYTFSTFGESYAGIDYFYKMAQNDKPKKFEEFREKELCIIKGDYIDDIEVHRLHKIYVKLATNALLNDGVRVNSQTIDKVLEYLNHYLVLDESGYCYLIESEYKNGERVRFVHRKVKGKFVDSYPSIKTEIEYWIQSPEKSKTRQLVFRPFFKQNSDIRKEFNQFMGYKFQYKDNFVVDMEKINFILEHIKTVLFNNKSELYNFYFQVLHNMFTNPSQKTGILVNFFGKPGIGKTIISELISLILTSENSVSVATKDRLVQKFNKLLENKILITVEECTSVGKEKHGFFDELKAKVTNKTIISEAKFGETQEVEDFSNYHFISNNPFNTKIEAHDRRVFCNEPNDDYILKKSEKENLEYFERLRDDKNSDNVQEHFFHWICRFDKNIPLNRIPESESRKRQINLSADSVTKYICNKFPCMIRRDIKISSKELYQSYERYTRENGESVVSNKYMVMILKMNLPSLKSVRSNGTKYMISNYLNDELNQLRKKYYMDDYEDDDSDDEFLSDDE